MPVIEISSLSHPGVEVFSTLTETQLRNRTEPGKGIFIVESPKVITRALDSGYEPLAIYASTNILSVMLLKSLNVAKMCLFILAVENYLLR